MASFASEKWREEALRLRAENAELRAAAERHNRFAETVARFVQADLSGSSEIEKANLRAEIIADLASLGLS